MCVKNVTTKPLTETDTDATLRAPLQCKHTHTQHKVCVFSVYSQSIAIQPACVKNQMNYNP